MEAELQQNQRERSFLGSFDSDDALPSSLQPSSGIRNQSAAASADRREPHDFLSSSEVEEMMLREALRLSMLEHSFRTLEGLAQPPPSAASLVTPHRQPSGNIIPSIKFNIPDSSPARTREENSSNNSASSHTDMDSNMSYDDQLKLAMELSMRDRAPSPVLAVVPSLDCPGGHGLQQPRSVDAAMYDCNLCQVTGLKRGPNSLTCYLCDFDVCPACIDTASQAFIADMPDDDVEFKSTSMGDEMALLSLLPDNLSIHTHVDDDNIPKENFRRSPSPVLLNASASGSPPGQKPPEGKQDHSSDEYLGV